MRSIAVALILTVFSIGAAAAQVVALGASNTRAYDLPLSDAWPAKLEILLRQNGRNVSVSNQGINGDLSTGMLSRFDAAVPQGTRVLILECCGNDNKNSNPRFAVEDHDGNIRALVSKAKARGIAVVFLANIMKTAKTRPASQRRVAPALNSAARYCKAYPTSTAAHPATVSTRTLSVTTWSPAASSLAS